jgi:hypothetical protein
MKLESSDTVSCEVREFEELATYLLGDGHAMRFRARGSSMLPAVRDGDILEVRPIAAAALATGDIVLYRSFGSGIVVHRVVDIRKQEEKTLVRVKGDSSALSDPQVEQSRLLGRVESIQRRGNTIYPRGWPSRYSAPIQARLFRQRRWVFGLVRQARVGLSKVVAVLSSDP